MAEAEIKALAECEHCRNGRWIIKDATPAPCPKCNPDGTILLKTGERCLGCGRDTSERDCGCPAGTYQTIEPQTCAGGTK
jgi:hypothetical protein